MAMDASFPPFEDLDEAGQPVGFDVDLAQAIAARWGVQLQIEGVGFDGLVDAVGPAGWTQQSRRCRTNPSLPRTWLFPSPTSRPAWSW